LVSGHIDERVERQSQFVVGEELLVGTELVIGRVGESCAAP